MIAVKENNMAKKRKFMGIDQYGETYHSLEYPRKELMERLGNKHISKMFITRGEKDYHIGYIIAGLWIQIYEVTPWTKPA